VKISESVNINSAPAFSLDRLKIHHEKFDHISISPVDKFSFINRIKEVNPEIEIQYKEQSASR
jgi:hypothetical protein